MTMEPSMLKEIVLPPSLMRKLLSAAGVSGCVLRSAPAAAALLPRLRPCGRCAAAARPPRRSPADPSLNSHPTAPFTAPIPWRRQGIRHNNNEIFLDIDETLDAVFDSRGNVLQSAVWGRILCLSRLTGNPDLLLRFPRARETMLDPAFHPCIRCVQGREGARRGGARSSGPGTAGARRGGAGARGARGARGERGRGARARGVCLTDGWMGTGLHGPVAAGPPGKRVEPAIEDHWD